MKGLHQKYSQFSKMTVVSYSMIDIYVQLQRKKRI